MVLSAMFMVGTIASGCGNGGTTSSAPVSSQETSETSKGHTAYQGHGAPAAELGEDGDTYTDVDTNKLYKKEDGVWKLVSNPDPKHYSGEGAPAADLGENGDTYTDTVNGAEYEKRNGEWVMTKEGDNLYTVSFNLNGGHLPDGSTFMEPQTVREGRWAKEPAISPIKENCTFVGWYEESSDTKWAFNGTAIMGNVSLIAKWKVHEDQKVIVMVDPNNGEDQYEYETFVGDRYYPTIPDYPGYNFIGWFVESTGEKYSGIVTADLAHTMIVAHWEKSTFNVAYRVEENDEITVTGLLDVETVSVSIPNVINGRNVTKISSTAFNNRIYLESVNIPSNIKVIEEGAFRGTWRLVEVNVDSANTAYTSDKGIVYTKDMTELVVHPTKAGTSYTCPATLKKIGAYAFADTKDMGITSINLNNGLEVIGKKAFYMNETLQSITLPETLKRIEDGAFYGPIYMDDESEWISPQGVITNINLPESLEYIGEMAFANQYFKNTFTLPNHLKEIGAYAFVNCTAITKVIIGKGLEKIGYNAFSGCTGILDIGVASGCENFTVVDKVLYTKDMKKLVLCPSGRTEALEVPSGVTELGDCAFYMVDQLEGLTLPDTLVKIGEECFAQTYEIASFAIPNSVKEMGKDCFYESGIRSVTIGTGLEAIPSGCFDSTRITSITIPGNVKTIGEGAFAYTPLANLVLEEGVKAIDYFAFARTSLKTLDMPNSLESIGDNAFSGTGITALNIKDGLKTLGKNAFTGADSSGSMTVTLKTVTVSSGNQNFAASDGILFSKDMKTLYGATTSAGVPDGTSYTVTIPNGVEIIADWAFSGCNNFKTISMPATVTEIGMGAFYHCSFKAIEIPAACKTIGEGAFNNNFSLEDVTFNEGLEEIGPYAFSLTWVTSADLPDTLKKIGENAFANCMGLTSLSLGANVEEIGDFAFADNRITGEVTIGAKCTKIGEGAFASTLSTYGQTITKFTVDEANPNYASGDGGNLLVNKDATTIYALAGGRANFKIPTTVTEIANYGLASCKNTASSLAIPSSVKKIGDYAFLGLCKITAMYIPNTVEYIGAQAFRHWLSNQTITFYCSIDYALSHFHQYFNVGGSAKFVYAE